MFPPHTSSLGHTRTIRSPLKAGAPRWRPAAAVLVAAAIALGAAPAASAQLAGQQPSRDLEGIEIDERVGDRLPLDLTLTNEEGEAVRLGDYFKGDGVPVVLNFVYFHCPMLCSLAMDGKLNVLRDLAEQGWEPGDRFRVLTVSFNHREGPELASAFKERYVGSLGLDDAADGWTFLTGDEANIERLTAATGFKFRWIEEQQDYAHAAALMIATPDGTLSRYLHGVFYDPQTLRLTLVEASDGAVGSVTDNALLWLCLIYDPEKGQYGPAAMKIMRAGGALTIAALGVALALVWRRERRRRRLGLDGHSHGPGGRGRPAPA